MQLKMKRILNFLLTRVFPLFSIKTIFVKTWWETKQANLFYVAPQESGQTGVNIDADFKSDLIRLQNDARMQTIQTMTRLYAASFESSTTRMDGLVCGTRSPVLRAIQPAFPERFPEKTTATTSIDEALYWSSIRGS